MISKYIFIITVLFVEFLFLGYSSIYDYSLIGEEKFGQMKKIFQEDRLYAGNLNTILDFENKHKLRVDSIENSNQKTERNKTDSCHADFIEPDCRISVSTIMVTAYGSSYEDFEEPSIFAHIPYHLPPEHRIDVYKESYKLKKERFVPFKKIWNYIMN